MTMTNPYPSTPPYPDPCSPTPPVPTKPALANGWNPDVAQVDDKTPYQVGSNANRTAIVITNQGDGLSPVGGSVIYVTNTANKTNAKSRGVRIPPGAGRVFTHTAEMFVISETTGMPAGGNLVDFQNEGYFA